MLPCRKENRLWTYVLYHKAKPWIQQFVLDSFESFIGCLRLLLWWLESCWSGRDLAELIFGLVKDENDWFSTLRSLWCIQVMVLLDPADVPLHLASPWFEGKFCISKSLTSWVGRKYGSTFCFFAMSTIWEVSPFQHRKQFFSNCLEWWKYLKDQFYKNTRRRKKSWKHIPVPLVPLVPLNHLIENQILPAQEALQIYLWSFAYEHLAILRRSPLWIFCGAVTGSHPVNLWRVMGSIFGAKMRFWWILLMRWFVLTKINLPAAWCLWLVFTHFISCLCFHHKWSPGEMGFKVCPCLS